MTILSAIEPFSGMKLEAVNLSLDGWRQKIQQTLTLSRLVSIDSLFRPLI